MKIFLMLCFLTTAMVACAQNLPAVINPQEVKRIETTLASDDMRGRRSGTPDIDRAAAFIADEFKKAGLQPFAGNGFLQEFVMVRPKLTTLKYEIGNTEIDPKNIVVITTQPELKVDEKSGYEFQTIAASDNYFQRVQAA